MVLIQRILEAGDLVSITERSKPLPRDTKRQRAEKHRMTCEAQKRLNNKTAMGKCAFLLAANFMPYHDYFVTLTYSEESQPKNREEARKCEKAFFRKLRTVRRKRGHSLKYVSATEGKHGDKRFHHHVIINATAFEKDLEDIKTLWNMYGHADIRTLFDKAHRRSTWFSVARYLTKERPEDGQDITPVGARVYTCSKNLIHPKPTYRIINENEHAELPQGAELIDGLPQGEIQTIVDGIPIKLRYLTYQRRPHYIED